MSHIVDWLIICLYKACDRCQKYVVLTVKINHRTPETRLNPYLIYLSRLEQIHVELMDEHMGAHGGASGS